MKRERRTHRDCNAEQTADHAINIGVNVIVACGCTIHRQVGFRHTKTEQIWLADSEVEVLVENLADAFGSACFGCLSCKVFK